MNIAYSCNDSYIQQTGISMISLFENNKDVDNINIYLISKDINENNIELLCSISDKYQRNLIVIKFEDIAFDLKLSSTGRHIETIYSKVFFSRIKGLDKVIYLDSDTIIVGSLEGLWNMPLFDVYMGVAETLPSPFREVLQISEDEPSFNDGMALVNVSFCREHHLIEKVLKVVEKFNGAPPVLSEGALNSVCQGKVEYISLRYNLMAGLLYFCDLDVDYMTGLLHYTKDDLIDSCKNPVVIHYLAAFYNRPWFIPCTHPYKDQFYKYKAMSPWKDVPLIRHPLPIKLRLMDKCFRWLGVSATYKLRNLLLN